MWKHELSDLVIEETGVSLLHGLPQGMGVWAYERRGTNGFVPTSHGTYDHHQECIDLPNFCQDVNLPSTMLHEYGHAWDYYYKSPWTVTREEWAMWRVNRRDRDMKLADVKIVLGIEREAWHRAIGRASELDFTIRQIGAIHSEARVAMHKALDRLATRGPYLSRLQLISQDKELYHSLRTEFVDSF